MALSWWSDAVEEPLSHFQVEFRFEVVPSIRCQQAEAEAHQLVMVMLVHQGLVSPLVEYSFPNQRCHHHQVHHPPVPPYQN